MTFLFLQEKRFTGIDEELRGVLGEAATSLVIVRRSHRRLKDGNFELDDEFRSGPSCSDIGEAISQFFSKESFLSARLLAKKLAASPHTIREILTRDLGMKKFT
jgi:hypothetical protein